MLWTLELLRAHVKNGRLTASLAATVLLQFKLPHWMFMLLWISIFMLIITRSVMIFQFIQYLMLIWLLRNLQVMTTYFLQMQKGLPGGLGSRGSSLEESVKRSSFVAADVAKWDSITRRPALNLFEFECKAVNCFSILTGCIGGQ
ncbi:hypothetical protein RchiOBHm_Chr1g0363531 [Rosa chinensis]|uniref:Uncharacterized protein n=1 Tax=Rosa chinensis TaxID=74649 RepID=A0A2P6SJH5_ROSCH|nr:hypothetical protein RchiOBHm_Chr1g0363531 [Rosa chinensis]